ncbi:hypothetical protein QYE76_025751 [Lolium multiflorum]|uniref:Retroviral polymerase SH3-like domain-containing protein n=1 Tax=Lolium multiflorum TaxID=4521 RepID=A0AAD8RIF7_LOLMU|nr:hypothetical protein QYE76_025751 [Lolium multiflorum]
MLRTLNDCVRTLLFHASMPPRFWPDALATVTLLVNIHPCRVRWSYTPHHLLYGVPPAYDDLRIFGCRCYPNTAATAAHKLAPRSLPCVFLGYPANTKGYRCYDPVSHRVLTSRHVYFDELVFPFQQGLLATPPTMLMTHKYRGSVTRCSGGDGGVDGGDDDDDDDDGDDVQLDDDGDGVDFPLREGISPADSFPPESSFLSVFSAPQRRL